jgi:hypothetical protein
MYDQRPAKSLQSDKCPVTLKWTSGRTRATRAPKELVMIAQGTPNNQTQAPLWAPWHYRILAPVGRGFFV